MAELCSQAMVRYGHLSSDKEKWYTMVTDVPLSPDWLEQLAEIQEGTHVLGPPLFVWELVGTC